MYNSYQLTQDFLMILIDVLIVIEIFVLPALYIIETSIKEVQSWSIPTPQELNNQIDQPIKEAKTSTRQIEVESKTEGLAPLIKEKNPSAKQKKTKSKTETTTSKTRKTRSNKPKLETVQA